MLLFQSKYPEIIEECKLVNGLLIEKYSLCINRDEISFDQIIPFLFPSLKLKDKHEMAIELRLYREVVEFYNKGEEFELTDQILSTLSVPILESADYENINSRYRSLVQNDLFSSYLRSTERVFYRFEILRKYKLLFPSNSYNNFYNSVKIFSAFLLFDDDIFDLDLDLQSRKNTILIQFLEDSDFNIQLAIDEILFKLKDFQANESEIFKDYVNCFISIYDE